MAEATVAGAEGGSRGKEEEVEMPFGLVQT